MKHPLALTIATSDSGGNAGIQADLKTFTSTGSFGTSALVALTAQNPDTVSAIQTLPIPFIQEQLARLFEYYPIHAIKTGMLFSSDIIECVANFLKNLTHIPPLVIDPVMIASSGQRLLKEDAIETLELNLIPLAQLITPNLDEAAVLLNQNVKSLGSIEECAFSLFETYKVPVLLKGGHLAGNIISDVLVIDQNQIKTFTNERIHGVNTHGSGCTLSSAIASYLAQGLNLETAVAKSRDYLHTALLNPVRIHREQFIHHAWPLHSKQTDVTSH
jgi:hydroxymethylpyrimidine/phosphomethylpyrimidine kinase